MSDAHSTVTQLLGVRVIKRMKNVLLVIELVLDGPNLSQTQYTESAFKEPN